MVWGHGGKLLPRREMVDQDILPALQALSMGRLVADAAGAVAPADDAATIELAGKLHNYLEQYVQPQGQM